MNNLTKILCLQTSQLPVIDDILALLGEARYVTSLYLKSGYWQVLMNETNREKKQQQKKKKKKKKKKQQQHLLVIRACSN